MTVSRLLLDPVDFGAYHNGTNDDWTGWTDCAAACAASGATMLLSGTPRLRTTINLGAIGIKALPGCRATADGGVTVTATGPIESAEPQATVFGGAGTWTLTGRAAVAGGTVTVPISVATPQPTAVAGVAGTVGTISDAGHVHPLGGAAGGDLAGSTYPNPVIAVGVVTAAKIAAGAVGPGPIANLALTTALIAVNAVTQLLSAFGVSSGPTTTSTAYVDLPDLFMTFTSTGAPILLLAYCDVSPSAANIGSFLGWNMDAGADNDLSANQVNASEFSTTLIGFAVTQPAAGSHTFKARWKLGAAGTLTAQGIRRGLVCIEIKR